MEEGTIESMNKYVKVLLIVVIVVAAGYFVVKAMHPNAMGNQGQVITPSLPATTVTTTTPPPGEKECKPSSNTVKDSNEFCHVTTVSADCTVTTTYGLVTGTPPHQGCSASNSSVVGPGGTTVQQGNTTSVKSVGTPTSGTSTGTTMQGGAGSMSAGSTGAMTN